MLAALYHELQRAHLYTYNNTLTYKYNHRCNERIIHSISYSEFAGIMIGMIIFGSLSDIIGRNAAGIMTSLCMLGGVTVMSFMDSASFDTLFLVWR
jgi:MFS family permease